MKKAFGIILAVILCSLMMCQTVVVFADETTQPTEGTIASIKLNGTEVKSQDITGEDTFTVSYYLKADLLITSGDIFLEYDKSMLKLTGFNAPEITGGSIASSTSFSEDPYKFNFTGVNGKKSGIYNFKDGKVFVEAVFKVLPDVKGEASVNLNICDLDALDNGVSASYFDDSAVTEAGETLLDSLSNPTVEPSSSKTTVKLTAAKTTVYVNASTKVKAVVSNQVGAVKFKSSSTKIATVKANANTAVVTGKKAGTVTITATNNRVSASVKIKVVKKTNPMTVKANTLNAKTEKTMTFSKAKAFTVKNAKGAVSFKKTSGNKKITVKTSGKVTVKKGLKKGTYKVKVKVTAKGNTTYKAKTKVVTLTVKVK